MAISAPLRLRELVNAGDVLNDEQEWQAKKLLGDILSNPDFTETVGGDEISDVGQENLDGVAVTMDLTVADDAGPVPVGEKIRDVASANGLGNIEQSAVEFLSNYGQQDGIETPNLP